MKTFTTFISILIGLSILIIGGLQIYNTIILLPKYFGSLDKTVQTAIVTAMATMFIAIATVFFGRRLERQKEVEIAQREKKIAVYEKFNQFWFEFFLFSAGKIKKKKITEQDVLLHISDFSQQIILWGSDDVVIAFSNWRMHVVKNSNIETGTLDHENIILFEKILSAMRKDVGHTSKLKQGTILSLFLNEPDLISKLQSKR
jgi:hypothetical protein